MLFTLNVFAHIMKNVYTVLPIYILYYWILIWIIVYTLYGVHGKVTYK